ncbi:hypothetical protein QFC19_001403 [Naganishia cerealis]|uniref:Uncharacterized protein n=1 Tax=Naganishia cerealis TaxID=610337 RepID=A0ACC2WI81_9TREE|nr:hypothetical protein QFC19_001403 [Naganishia cerealis]
MSHSYLALYLESFFALPIRREERILQYEQVVEELTDFAVSYDIGLSLDNNFEEIVHVSLVVEKSDYARAVGWLRDLLARSIFEQDRIEVIIRKLIQKLPGCCREPMDVLATVLSSLIRDKAKSTSEATGLWNRISFLPNVGTEVERDPNSVIDRLSLVRDLLIDPRGMRLSVAGDILNLAKPRTAWTTEFLSSTVSSFEARSQPASQLIVFSVREAVPLRPLPDPTDTMTALGISPSRKKGIRGAGLAYHTSINVDEEYGSLVFRVARSPNCVKAVLAAGSIVQGLVDGSVVLDVNTLDGARSSLAYKYAKKERNVSAAAMTVMVNEVLKGIPAKANADFLASLAHVTVHQVKAALLKHFLPLFDPNSSVMAVTCGTGLVQRIKKDLEDSGYHVEIRQMPKALEEDD